MLQIWTTGIPADYGSFELKKDEPGPAYGYVHHRYKGKAINAFVDGHSETLSFEAMNDMRKWCNIADSKDWVLRKKL